MTEAKFLELMSVASLFLQATVMLLAVIAYGYCEQKTIWRWFMWASIMVFIRRLTGAIEIVYNIDTNMIEAIITTAISIMWILFILKSTRNFLAHKERQRLRNDSN